MPRPRWMSPKNQKKRQNRRSGAQERQRATDLGGHRQAGSGASWRAPQDVVGAEHLESLKFTDGGAFSLSVRDWQALRADADRAGREPRMVIDFERAAVRLVITESDVPVGLVVRTTHSSFRLSIVTWWALEAPFMTIDFETAGTCLRLVVTEEPL